jgi:exonuclease SbcD
MKILHTADWHIGKKLHKQDLSKDFDLLISWLCEAIIKNSVEVLLVSGDIFDLANPSSEARKQYYRALIRLKKIDCKIILTGGNHDSPAMLDAPREILKELEMHVIGGLPENIEDVIIPVKNQLGKTEVIIAALPFLRDADLRNANEGNTYEDRLESIRKGIQNTFSQAAQLCKDQFPEVPAIAMGHLFAAGAETSDSERDIQIGNQAAFNALQFGEYFSYIALGHIHKPQRINGAVPTYYSGSPIPLSFSERKDEKRVLIIDTALGWEPQNIKVPAFRSLLKISGTMEEIQLKLEDPGQIRQLDSLIEVELIEEQYNVSKIAKLDDLVTSYYKPGFEIVKHRASFKNQLNGAGEIYKNQNLEDLKPKEVFLELLGRNNYDEDTQNEILSAFDELLEEVEQGEKPVEI